MFNATFTEENNTFQAQLVHEQVDEITAEGTRQKEIVETAGAGQVSAVTDAGEAQVQAIITEGTTQTNTIRAYCEEQQTIINQKVSAANGAKDDAVTAQEQAEAAQQIAETSARTAAQRAAEAAEHDILTQTAFTDAQQAQARKNINAEKSKGVYELIETVTLVEAVERVERTKEPDDTPYALKAALVDISTPAGAGTGTIAYVFMAGTTYLGFVSLGSAITATGAISSGEMFLRHGRWSEEVTMAGASTGTGTMYTYRSPVLLEASYPVIDRIRLVATTSNVPLPVGTVINIYGVRA